MAVVTPLSCSRATKIVACVCRRSSLNKSPLRNILKEIEEDSFALRLQANDLYRSRYHGDPSGPHGGVLDGISGPVRASDIRSLIALYQNEHAHLRDSLRRYPSDPSSPAWLVAGIRRQSEDASRGE
jgi:hypothetical protein